MPTFHAYAEQWWVRNEGWFADKTREDYKWRLERNLLPYFGEHALDRITFDTVEKYIAAKLDEDKPLSARSINMTLVLLSSILETAVERELIDRNPASGQRRRVRERGPRRTQVDTADAIGALLAAAGELDGKRRGRYRRALLATLLFAGLRVSELCGLRWRDVDLATGWLTAEDSKTDAGRRRVKLRGTLRDELAAIRPLDADPDGYVFGTSTGGPQNPSNIRNRILAPAVDRASECLTRAGGAPLPHLTPHSCRRTFASVLYALGERRLQEVLRWAMPDSNRRLPACKAGALPAELTAPGALDGTNGRRGCHGFVTPARRSGGRRDDHYLRFGCTTRALPPPRRTGSAIASARPFLNICSAVASPG